jgi:CHAD domain-containing protein
MKLNKETLKQIIKEELQAVLNEDYAYSDDRDQDERIEDNTEFVSADISSNKESKSIFRNNKDQIYKIVLARFRDMDRVRSMLGQGNATNDAIHDLLNKAIDSAGSVRVAGKNVRYFNELFPAAATEEIDDLIGKLDGQRKLQRVRELSRGSENKAIATHVVNYLSPIVTKFLDENRNFLQKAGSFFTGKGFKEE